MEQPPSPVAPVVVGKRSASAATSLVLVVAALVAVGGLAFAIGRVTAPAATTDAGGAGFPSGFQGLNRALPSGAPFGGRGGQFAGGATVQGTVSAISTDSVTLTIASGESVQIPLDASTTYHRQADASAGDVRTGAQVLVRLSGGGFGGQLGGLGGQGGQGRVSPSPGASGALRLGTASSITIVSP